MRITFTIDRKGPGARLVGTRTAALLEQVVKKSAMDVESHAKLSILTGAKTGRMYGGHQASGPGEAPASDTGNLVNSIAAAPAGRWSWVVRAAARYAQMLEFGTVRMAARPFLRPALERVRVSFLQACAAAVRRGAGG